MTDPLADGLYQHWSNVDQQAWADRYPNFERKEIACRGTGEIFVNLEALDALQSLRNAVGRPLIVTSAYRSESHNKKVGGTPNSRHRTGDAFDISIANHDPFVLEHLARKHGFTGIGRYPKRGFIHIDMGRARWWGAPEWPGGSRVVFPEEEQAHSPKPAAKKAAGIGGAATIAGGAATVLGNIDVETAAEKVTALRPILPILEWAAANWWIALAFLVVAAFGFWASRRSLASEEDEAGKYFVPPQKARTE